MKLPKTPTWFIISVGICGLCAGLYVWLNWNVKTILKKEYNIESTGFRFNFAGLRLLQGRKIRNHLFKLGLLSETKDQKLVTLLRKEAEQAKPPSFVEPGIALAIGIPIWVSSVEQIFNTKTPPEAVGLSLAAGLMIYLAIHSYGAVKEILRVHSEMFYQKEFVVMDNLASLLEQQVLLLEAYDEWLPIGTKEHGVRLGANNDAVELVSSRR